MIPYNPDYWAEDDSDSDEAEWEDEEAEFNERMGREIEDEENLSPEQINRD